MTTLFAEFWLVKAENTPGAAACRRTQSGRVSPLASGEQRWAARSGRLRCRSASWWARRPAARPPTRRAWAGTPTRRRPPPWPRNRGRTCLGHSASPRPPRSWSPRRPEAAHGLALGLRHAESTGAPLDHRAGASRSGATRPSRPNSSSFGIRPNTFVDLRTGAAAAHGTGWHAGRSAWTWSLIMATALPQLDPRTCVRYPTAVGNSARPGAGPADRGAAGAVRRAARHRPGRRPRAGGRRRAVRPRRRHQDLESDAVEAAAPAPGVQPAAGGYLDRRRTPASDA
jgi:hypothetical protein